MWLCQAFPISGMVAKGRSTKSKLLGRVIFPKSKAKAHWAISKGKSTKYHLTKHILKDKSKRLAKVKIKLSNNEPKPDADEFRKNVTNMYLRNKLSAKDTATLVASAHASGAGQLDDIRNVGKVEGNPSNVI